MKPSNNNMEEKTGRLMNLIQAAIPVLIATFLLVNQFVHSTIMSWTMVGLSYVIIGVPILCRWSASRNKLTLRKALEGREYTKLGGNVCYADFSVDRGRAAEEKLDAQ